MIPRLIFAAAALAVVAFAAVFDLIAHLAPPFELRPVDRTPRSIFQTRRAGLA
jgi:hypothetical protein